MIFKTAAALLVGRRSMRIFSFLAPCTGLKYLKPDLILLDVAMPETDGGEVAARIQSDPTLHRTPIVFLTALVTKAETRSGLRIQGHPFLAKPISFSNLIKGIEENFRFRIYDFNAGPLWRTRRAALNAALRGEIHRKTAEPMSVLLVFACHRRQSSAVMAVLAEQLRQSLRCHSRIAARRLRLPSSLYWFQWCRRCRRR